MSFFLASFFASQLCMQCLQLTKEPGRNSMFFLIARLSNRLLHIVALNWCKNVASETGLGKCIKSYSTLLKITYPYITKSIIHDTVIFIIASHTIQKKIASLWGENQCHGNKNVAWETTFWSVALLNVAYHVLVEILTAREILVADVSYMFFSYKSVLVDSRVNTNTIALGLRFVSSGANNRLGPSFLAWALKKTFHKSISCSLRPSWCFYCIPPYVNFSVDCTVSQAY